ncbi:MAG TPA: M20/M25/M40 family metallo-hydrolase [Terriglobia bacterium]|nr:M20/M25/M40 family metallo-hydrolase [Terriglobia bacterium]
MKSVFSLPLLLALGLRLPGAPPPQSAANALNSQDWAQYQDMAVRLMREYLRIDTSNPPGDELRAADFFHRLFDANGIPNTVFPLAPNRADIYAILKGNGTLPPIILLNHMDVVRTVPGDWRVPPFSGDVVDGAIYGRGALDMKDIGLLQAMVLIIAAREHLQLKRDLIFLGTADEEVGDLGATWFLAHHADLLHHAEYLLTEGGTSVTPPGQATLYGIDVAEKAPLWIRVTAKSRGGHGSIPIPGSAPNRLVEAMDRVIKWQTPVHLLPLVEEYFHQIAQLQKDPLKTEFLHIRDSLKNPQIRIALARNPNFSYLLCDTVSLTVLHAGEQTNVIPSTADAELDVRLLPGDDPQDFLAQLQDVIGDPDLKVEPIGQFRKPNASSTATMLYRVIQEVIHQHDPQAVVAPELNSGYTESQMFRPLGITAYGFNPVRTTPELEETQHAANERVPVEQFQEGLKILFGVVATAASQ